MHQIGGKLWYIIINSPLGSRIVRGWAKASSCRLQVILYCAVLFHIVSFHYLSRSSLHRLAGHLVVFSCHYGIQVVTREVHRLSFRPLMCPAQDHFYFLTLLTMSVSIHLSSFWPRCYSFCPYDVEHTSIHVGLCGKKFDSVCLVPCFCTIGHIWQHTVVHLSLQAGDKVVERDSSVVECRTRNRESPGSNPLCYRYEVCAFSFTSRRLSRLSCINEYLAIDSGGNVSE